MNKPLVLLPLLFIALNVFSQENYIKLPNAKTKSPTYILNKNIIGNQYLVENLGDSKEEVLDKVNEISVLKYKPDRENSDFYNLTSQGLILVELKKSVPSKTQSELNDFFGMDAQSDIYIDGYLLESKKYKIAIEGITEIEIVEPDTLNGLGNSVLNIWTLTKKERYQE
nr:hypothetical protein [uncultured Allomuricauda sp.]